MPATDLETVIAIPPLPFRQGRVDIAAHERNVSFLIRQNHLSGGRRRAIAIGGTSLIQHLDPETLIQVTRATAQTIEQRAVLVAGIVPTPLAAARSLIESLMVEARAPDYFLLMPVPGIASPEGIRRDLGGLIESCHRDMGARFLLYLRQSTLVPVFIRMLNEVEGLEGVKVGTVAREIRTFLDAVPAGKAVLWGVGDRATEAAERGSLGHTSGITLLCPRACDGIHNAYRAGDFEEAYRLERIVTPLEDIRFDCERAYNYSAVVAAAALAGFQDVDLGDEGPFNAAPPEDVLRKIEQCMKTLADFH